MREGWIGPWAGPAKHASNSRERYITSWIAATGVNRSSGPVRIASPANAGSKPSPRLAPRSAGRFTPMSSCRIIFIWWSRRPSPALRDRRDEMVSPYTSRFNRRPRASSPICSPVATNRWWWLNRGALGDGNSRPSEPPVVSPEAVWRIVSITNLP